MEGGVRAAVHYVVSAGSAGSGGSGGLAACPKVWFRVGETILLRGGVIFEKFEPPEAAPPQKHRAFMGGGALPAETLVRN